MAGHLSQAGGQLRSASRNSQRRPSLSLCDDQFPCAFQYVLALTRYEFIPLGMLGVRNLSPHPLFYYGARRLMDIFRAVNEFVFALMFVTAVGLGPFAGMLALGVHTGGVLGKLLSETIEALDPGQVEGVAAVGAS